MIITPFLAQYRAFRPADSHPVASHPLPEVALMRDLLLARRARVDFDVGISKYGPGVIAVLSV